MEKLNDLKKSLDQTEALVQICKDMVDQKKRETRLLFIALIISIITNIIIIGSFLWYESNWDYKTSQVDSTTTTTTQEVDGKDNDIINGDQYNDKAENNSGGND